MKLFKTLLLIICQILVTTSTVYSWSSMESTRAKGYQGFGTHQYLNARAYEALEEHPAFKYISFPTLEDIQEHGGVTIFKTGLGPDVEGNSKFTDHWYNPANQQGKAPETIEDLFILLKKSFNNPIGNYTDAAAKEQRAHLASYVAHYIQDMTCPMHVSGMLGGNASISKPGRLKDISPYFEGLYSQEHWQKLVNRYKKAKDGDTNFFDPLYYDGIEPSETVTSSHFQYELQVEAKYMSIPLAAHEDIWAEMRLEGLIPDGYKNDKKDSGDNIKALAKISAKLTRERIGTKNNQGPLWIDINHVLDVDTGYDLGINKKIYDIYDINRAYKAYNLTSIYDSLKIPYEDWWRAIQLTYVTWRSSFSALHAGIDDIKLVKISNQPGKYKFAVAVENLEPDAPAKNVKVKYKIEGDINTSGTINLSDDIPKGDTAGWYKANKTIHIDDPQNLSGKTILEIEGKYDDGIPDSGYKRIEYELTNIWLEAVSMPDVVGHKKNAAIKPMERSLRNFNVTIVSAGFAPTENLENKVESQKPTAGELMAPGDDVVLYVYDGPPEPEDLNPGLEDIGSRLDEISQELDNALTLSNIVNNGCNSAREKIGGLVSQAASNQKELIAIEARLVALFKKSGELKKAEQDIKKDHSDMEKQAEKVAEFTHDLEKLSLDICEKTRELNDYTKSDGTHQQNHKWISNQKTKLRSLLDAIKLIIKNAKIKHNAGGIQPDQSASTDDESGEKIKQALEKATGNLNAGKISISNVSSIFSDITEKSIKAVSIRDALQAELEKLKNHINTLPQTDPVKQIYNKNENLIQKAGSIQPNDCVITLSVSLNNAIENSNKNEELLHKVIAFYITQEQQLLKNDTIQKSIQKTVQNISFLIDLSNTYLERARNVAKDGALCTVLADDIMQKEFAPDVTGMKIDLAQSTLSIKGFVTNKIKNKDSSNKLQLQVTKQIPDHTKRRARGSQVEVYYNDKPSKQENAGLNCSRLPGSQEMVNINTGERLCDCPATKIWNADFTACIDKNNALPSFEEIKNASIDLHLSLKNCSQFPGTEPVWDKQKDEAVCACKKDLVLNANGNGCITRQQEAIEKADCSRYPGMIVVWNNQLNEPRCNCPKGSEWIPNLNQCMGQKDLAVASLDCSPFPNTTSAWDQAQQKAVCACIQGTILNRNGNGCIDQREVALENTDCSRFPGTFPEWNYQNNQPMCNCLSGSHWDDNSRRCVNEAFLSCSEWPNTLLGWNTQTQKFECMCMSPNKIDQGTGECISWLTALTQQQNPSGNNGSNPPPPATIKPGQCNEAKRAGRNEPERHEINMNNYAGQFIFEYKTFTEEDMIKVSQPDGRVLFQTGCVGSGNGWTKEIINFSGYSPKIIVDVYPNCDGGTNTQWEFKVSCPN